MPEPEIIELIDFEEWELFLDRQDFLTQKEYHLYLEEARKSINAELAVTTALTQRTRLNAMKKYIDSSFVTVFENVNIMEPASRINAKTMQMSSSLGIEVSATSIAATKRINDPLTIIPMTGYSIKDMVTSTQDASTRKIQSLVNAGIMQGKSVDEITADLTPAFQSIEKRHIKTIVNTTNSEIQSRSMAEQSRGSDVIGWMSYSVMDTRTTPLCRKLNETERFKADGHTPESLKADGWWPPRHWNCRTVILPIPQKGTMKPDFGVDY